MKKRKRSLMKKKFKSTILRIFLTAILTVFILFCLLYSVSAYFETHQFVWQGPIQIKLKQPLVIKKRQAKFLNPLVKEIRAVEIETKLDPVNLDEWIGQCADKFATKTKTASYLRYQLHCLANKESSHHTMTTCGDSGLACGLYQYHQTTWQGFRKEMLAKGLITEIGSRLNDKQAVETTAWALANNRDGNWGPWVRGECR